MKPILGLVVIAIAACSTIPGTSIRDAELSLGGIALGETEQMIIARLGQPSQRLETGEGTEFQYPGLSILVGWPEQQAPGVPRRAFQITATGPSTCTPSGICPGMPFDRAVSRYGQPVITPRLAGSFMEYYSNQSSCWLQIAAPNGTIQSIAAVCQP